jgi:hypothetical protein
MPTTDIDLVNRALTRLGAQPIASFADAGTEAATASALYPPARDALIAGYPWRFATRRAALTRAMQDPEADYAHAFDLPVDFLRALSLGTAGRARGLNFAIAGQAVLADADPVVLTYIAQVGEAVMPPHVQDALVARLTAEFCLPLTESTSRAEMLARAAEDALATARRIDAQQDSPRALTGYPLIEARR